LPKQPEAYTWRIFWQQLSKYELTTCGIQRVVQNTNVFFKNTLVDFIPLAVNLKLQCMQVVFSTFEHLLLSQADFVRNL
jgi:hypothetical protein